MTYDDEGSLFDEEFDFVDEDDVDESEDPTEESVEEEAAKEEKPPAAKPKRKTTRKGKRAAAESTEESESDSTAEAEPEKPAEPVGPPADHVVHVYEFGDYKRTIQREFTGEDAEAFAVEFNRTSAAHSRMAVAASREVEPAPTI